MLVKRATANNICARSRINNDVRASCLIRSRILHTLTVFIRASRAKFTMTIVTSRVVIPVTHGQTVLSLINIIASHRYYLQNTGKMGEIAPCLRAAFIIVHIGCASLAPVHMESWFRPVGSAAWGSSRTLQWRHNESDCVSNHQPHHCLLNRLNSSRRSKKTPMLRVTGLCAGN